MAKKKVDWIELEKEYRAGQKSIRELARLYNCSAQAIVKHAKKYNWNRDLSDSVRKAIRAKLNQVDSKVDTDNVKVDSEIIEQASETGLQLVLSHRKDIASLRKLEEQLISELTDNPTKLYLAQYQGEIIEKTVGLTASEKSMAANNLANVQHKRIQLERQAFNIDSTDAPGSKENPINVSVKFVAPPQHEESE